MANEKFGQPYSHFYSRPTEPIPLSKKMRERLLAVAQNRFGDGLLTTVREEIGFAVYSLHNLFRDGSEEDVLSAITAIRNHCKRMWPQQRYAADWVETARGIFEQEHASYLITDLGEVRYRHDREFSRNAAATISVLSASRCANALELFESGQHKISQTPPDGKGAIRDTFFAAENIFRLLFPDEPRLVADAARNRLQPLLQKQYGDDRAALGASSKQLSSFMNWIDAAHFYRHEPGTEEPAQPPVELAVELVSVGAAFIRLLAGLNPS
jgi:hypothetical protein